MKPSLRDSFLVHGLGYRDQESVPLGKIALSDGIDTQYNFDIFDIHALPDRSNAVYAFVQQPAFGLYPYNILYIGKAEQLRRRLYDHEKKQIAISCGANRLLVHKPAWADKISYSLAEERLIRAHAPILNVQHNPWSGFLGILG